jgi:fructokinase
VPDQLRPEPALLLLGRPRRLRALVADLLPQLDVLKLADDEIEFVTGEADPVRALRALADRGVRLPVVTLGPRGVVALREGRLLEAAAPRVEVVDQTGAGDGFERACWPPSPATCAPAPRSRA